MTEMMLQYVWEHRLWPAHVPLATVDGRRVEVLSQGVLNTGSGPDFSGAMVKIDGQLWAGDVEIHLRASDWHRHGHDTDAAYSCVALHVVAVDDAAITRPGYDDFIPQMVMRLPPGFEEEFNALTAGGPMLPCAWMWGRLPAIYLHDWLTALTVERLYTRSDRLLQLLHESRGDMEQLTFVVVARALGFGRNADPMERLARATPLTILYKHSDSVLQVEALLFGQAGLLADAAPDSEYAARLLSEYMFLKGKYGLRPLDDGAWQMRGMRPPKFPHRSIARLAALVCAPRRLHSRLLGAFVSADPSDEARLRDVFETEPAPWWHGRYTFRSDPSERPAPTRLSRTTLNLLAINVLVPLRMIAAINQGSVEAADEAVSALERLDPEHNSLTAPFERFGVEPANAADSQALIHLHRAYCDCHKCLYCRVGHRMLLARAGRTAQ